MRSFLMYALVSAFIFVGCSEKNEIVPDNKESLDDDDKIEYIEDVSMRNGILYFKSIEQYFYVCEKLGSFSEAERDEWEKELGFISLRREVGFVLDKLDKCENELEYLSLINDNRDILEINDDEIKPIIESDSYATIANRDGFFYIGDVLHKVQDSRIVFSRTGSVSKMNEALQGLLKSPDSDVEVNYYKSDEILKSSGCGFSHTSSYSTSNRRCRFDVSTFIRVAGTNTYTWREVVVEAKVSNYRKNTWGNWTLYHAGCEIRNLDIVVTAPGGAILNSIKMGPYSSHTYQWHSYGVNDTPIVSNGSSASGVRSTTLWWYPGDVILNTYPGGYVLPQPVFIRVKGKASNTGIGLGVKWVEIDCK